jgi:predicted DNA-binding protein
MRNKQAKRYDVRFQLYRHDYERLKDAAKRTNRSHANYAKTALLADLDIFIKALEQIEERR